MTGVQTCALPIYRTTGVPTRETLEKYDLADMADDLEKRGIYAQNTAAAE